MQYRLRTSFAGSIRRWSVPGMNGAGNGHSRQVGSHAIDFMQEFFGMSYPEAVSYLLDGEQGQLIERGKRQETRRKAARGDKGRQAVEKEQTEERTKGTETAGEKSDHEESLCISSAEASY